MKSPPRRRQTEAKLRQGRVTPCVRPHYLNGNSYFVWEFRSAAKYSGDRAGRKMIFDFLRKKMQIWRFLAAFSDFLREFISD